MLTDKEADQAFKQLKTKLERGTAQAARGELLDGEAVFEELRQLIEKRRRRLQEGGSLVVLIDFTSPTKQSAEVSRTMYHSQNINSVRERSIKDQHVLETSDAKDSQWCQLRTPNPRAPAHVGLSGEQCKCLVRGGEEAQGQIQIRIFGKIVGVAV